MSRNKITGYKASNNGFCKHIKYTVGNTYNQIDEETYEIGDIYIDLEYPIMCNYGFHYCLDIDDTLSYYKYERGVTKFFEILDVGEGYSNTDKSVTNRIRIMREIPLDEYNTLFKRNTFDDRGNIIEKREEDEVWSKFIYDENNNLLLYYTSNGYWKMCTYDHQNRIIRSDYYNGYWNTWYYNEDGTRKCNDTGHGEPQTKRMSDIKANSSQKENNIWKPLKKD